MYMGQLRLGEQAVQLPKLGGGQRIGGGIFHRYTRGCGKLLRLFAASQEKQGEQRQEGAALDHGSPPCWIISAIVPQESEKEKGGGTLNASPATDCR